MEMPVDALRERPADAFHLRDIVDRRRLHAAQAAEMLDQRLASLGTDAGNFVQHRRGATLSAPRAMPDDRKPVRLIADLLDEMQAGMRWRELEAACLGLDDELFHAGLAFRSFRHADDRHLVEPQVGEHGPRDADLAFTAVDQHEIGNLAAFGGDARVAALEYLAHRRVVVAGRDVTDV